METVLRDGLRPFKLKVEDYVLLDQRGAFDGLTVELIEGVVVTVNAELSQHVRLKNDLTFRLRLALREIGSRLDAWTEPTLELPPHNMPMPDVVVSETPPVGTYLQREQVAIVVEVGATSLHGDLGLKREMYAAHAIPEYWVVDVEGRRVHQFWGPRDGDFVEHREVPLDGPLASVTIAGLAIDGGGIL